ncbi:hypothetical protein BH09MYX1_BH09MYX1_63280 [soil metagenome]
MRARYSIAEESGPVIASVWHGGHLLARAELPKADVTGTPIDGVPGTVVYERVVGTAPVLRLHPLVTALSFVPGRDGVKVTLDGKSTILTPDDLLAAQAYDHGIQIEAVQLGIGLDMALVAVMAARRLNVKPIEVEERAELERLRTERSVPSLKPAKQIEATTLTDADLREGVGAAAHYLGRGISADGHFRYFVDAATGEDKPGYDWPRHAGTTLFVAQAGRFLGDAILKLDALQAAQLLRGSALHPCGAQTCIGEGDTFEIGSAALALMAFAEIASSNLDRSYAPLVQALAELLLSQQRPDGDFMHQVTSSGKKIDVQFLYFSGEATLALARAHALLCDPRYLECASRGLSRLVGSAWSFFGDRYYFGEEHWTCQAMGELWDRAPDPKALDFCVRWMAYSRAQQQHQGDSLYDGDGAYQFGTIVTPRLTPAASRCEAGVATLSAADKAGIDPAERARIREQLRRSFALLLRHQLPGQSAHLMVDPRAVAGAIPGSDVDWALRIDYAQHTGSAMIRWLELPPP